MKQSHGWWFPDHEVHLIDWMNSKKNKVVMNGRSAYQGAKQLAALKHCKQFRTAVDVGGHVGLWSFNLAHRFNWVHAFEPVAAHRECFASNVFPHQGKPGYVTLYPLALGAEPGFVSIDTETGSSGNSAVFRTRTGETESRVLPVALDSTEGPYVEMRTLDSFGFQELDFLKIDTEGFEENVLRGGEQTIKACKPVIVVEQKRDMASRFGLEPLGAVRLLESWGYRIAEEISGDFIMVSG